MMNEDELQARDTEVENILRKIIEDHTYEAHEHYEHYQALMREVKKINHAVDTEQWFMLSEYLDSDTIESLSEISPAGLIIEE